ncbi:hypothetical protein BB8028_0001g03640 [Beauveria bassiana]|uniref:Uncharacterized protein n=1 Tax=Beauveria bassiana TaxID=176275 RepID=A0A2S7XWK6_BEABA|nr:hypothetical protein BB8028_0001g03640 [Beauveria bassiana]
MAQLRDRKRKRFDEPSSSDQRAKKAKPPIDHRQQGSSATKTRSRAVRKPSNFTPSFWDNLSKFWLTPRALRELDRRNNFNSVARPPTSAELRTTSLARFATRGGPDLCHLRGCLDPEDASAMSSSRSSTPSSRRTKSTKATSSQSKRSSAYTKNFEQDLIDNKIYPRGYWYPDDDLIPEPSNLDDIVQALSAPRDSLSPSSFPRSKFQKFALANDRVISETKVTSDIISTIRGDADIPSEGDLPFTNLDSITKGRTVDPVPDSYDGADPQAIHTKALFNSMLTTRQPHRADLSTT